MRAARPRSLPTTVVALCGLAAVLAWPAAAASAADTPPAPGAAARRSQPPPPIRTTMKDLHGHGGVPPRWKFLMPPGDPGEGRKVFVALECYACHAVQGEDFPSDAKTARGSGPELTGMGAHHPAEYFAESILNPNRVIVEGPGYTGPDRLSKMPSYADTMTLRQLVDVVAYLRSLRGDAMSDHHGMSGMGGSMKMK